MAASEDSPEIPQEAALDSRGSFDGSAMDFSLDFKDDSPEAHTAALSFDGKDETRRRRYMPLVLDSFAFVWVGVLAVDTDHLDQHGWPAQNEVFCAASGIYYLVMTVLCAAVTGYFVFALFSRSPGAFPEQIWLAVMFSLTTGANLIQTILHYQADNCDHTGNSGEDDQKWKYLLPVAVAYFYIQLRAGASYNTLSTMGCAEQLRFYGLRLAAAVAVAAGYASIGFATSRPEVQSHLYTVCC